ncbi:MAG: N-(2-amino-2-carboxyethyl)-L-glutamate synthase [Actinomycetota bacterium]|nr:N-(2-amino-2-carboxyethyl)-L-glutamate synthase [Actinomycetota bacterium]
MTAPGRTDLDAALVQLGPQALTDGDATIIHAPQEFLGHNLYVDLLPVVGESLFLKCEGLNFAGSIKLRAAAGMVSAGERDGSIRPGMTLIESSSGNMGVALSIVAADRGYSFVCVTDSRCTTTSQRLMSLMGTRVEVISEPHPTRGLLGARLDRVAALCELPGHVWLNQYLNPANWGTHYRTTAPEIARGFPDLAVLFVGAGTTGTLMGCARYFREHRPDTTIVGIDSVGSVNFGGPPSTRHIPGLGAGVRPPILDLTVMDDMLYVPEADTVRTCRKLARHGYLFGGSTGTVVSGATRWMAAHPEFAGKPTVAISPDPGERYLDNVYDDEWVVERFGPHVLTD